MRELTSRPAGRLVAAAAVVGVLLGTACAEPNASSSRDIADVVPASTATTSTTTSTSTVAPSVATAASSPVGESTPVTSTTASPATAAVGPVVRSGANVDDDADPGTPLTLGIPDLDVVGDIVPVGLLADGTYDVPVDPATAGWLSSGPRPGERGPAVIAGHVDSRKLGPGLFWRLADLQVGAQVTITTELTTLTFVVDAVEQYPKDEFPTQAVYGPVPIPSLRLITCGGSFDSSTRHYRDNIVVYLSLL